MGKHRLSPEKFVARLKAAEAGIKTILDGISLTTLKESVTLAASGGDVEALRVIEMLKAHHNMSALQLTQAGVKFTDLSNWILNWIGAVNKFLVPSEAYLVMRDIAKEARTESLVCKECNGSGVQITHGTEDSMEGYVEEYCKVCAGRKRIMFPGDPLARKLLLEHAGWVAGAKGTNINIDNSQKTVALGDGNMEEIAARAQKILKGSRKALPPPSIEEGS